MFSDAGKSWGIESIDDWCFNGQRTSVTFPKEEACEVSFNLQLTTLAIDKSIDGMQTL
jgi:hypothetical protein